MAGLVNPRPTESELINEHAGPVRALLNVAFRTP